MARRYRTHACRIYNQLLSNAFGPEMAAEGREYRIPFAEKRVETTPRTIVSPRLFLASYRALVRVRMSDGSTRNVHLLGPTDIEKVRPWHCDDVTYEHPKLLPILRNSQIFARLEMQILHGFSTKYGMAL